MEAVFEVQNLTFRYPESDGYALNQISFVVERGSFLLIFGASASGKSTLLRHLKHLTAPFGTRSGDILFKGTEISALPPRRLAAEIGFVFQNPDTQLICEQVFDELAFGLEQTGMESPEIMRRIGETAAFFGIDSLLERRVDTLSGGQKQLVNLAAVTALRPSVIILDEPAAMLDPVAAADFYSMLYRLNREQGITVILCEHRCEEALPLSDTMLYMEDGCAASFGPVQTVLQEMLAHPVRRAYLPVPLRLLHEIQNRPDAVIPLHVRGLRLQFERYSQYFTEKETIGQREQKEKAISVKHLCFRYRKDGPDVLRDLSFQCFSGEIFALAGGNGAGKTTLLKLLAGLLRADGGKIKTKKRPLYMPQDPRLFFLKDTVEEDIAFQVSMDGLNSDAPQQLLHRYPDLFKDFYLLKKRNPMDLSGGELQQMAFFKVLLKEPDILLLDEPAKGLDARCRDQLGEILRHLADAGKTILISTHDMDFIADWADRAAMLFDGKINGCDTASSFLKDNHFYTTRLSKVMPEDRRGIVGLKYLTMEAEHREVEI